MENQKRPLKKTIRNLMLAAGFLTVLGGAKVVLKDSPYLKAEIQKTLELDVESIAERELAIHAGKACTGDGRTISPYLDHDCALDPSEKAGDFGERFQKYCRKNQISEEKIQQMMVKEPELFPMEKNISVTEVLSEHNWTLVEGSKSK